MQGYHTNRIRHIYLGTVSALLITFQSSSILANGGDGDNGATNGSANSSNGSATGTNNGAQTQSARAQLTALISRWRGNPDEVTTRYRAPLAPRGPRAMMHFNPFRNLHTEIVYGQSHTAPSIPTPTEISQASAEQLRRQYVQYRRQINLHRAELFYRATGFPGGVAGVEQWAYVMSNNIPRHQQEQLVMIAEAAKAEQRYRELTRMYSLEMRRRGIEVPSFVDPASSRARPQNNQASTRPTQLASVANRAGQNATTGTPRLHQRIIGALGRIFGAIGRRGRGRGKIHQGNIGEQEVGSPNSPHVAIYPNPVSTGENLYVQFNSKSNTQTASLNLYNNTGQLVWETSSINLVNTTIRIPITSLKSGIYILELTNSNTPKIQKRIIIR